MRSMVGASSLGTTGSNGLLDVPTPVTLRDRIDAELQSKLDAFFAVYPDADTRDTEETLP